MKFEELRRQAADTKLTEEFMEMGHLFGGLQ